MLLRSVIEVFDYQVDEITLKTISYSIRLELKTLNNLKKKIILVNFKKGYNVVVKNIFS